ncbi:MAG: FAD-dependent monooxygenase [Hyphomicrobium sp.]
MTGVAAHVPHLAAVPQTGLARSSSDQNVLIAGGGIAGLSCAVALARQGIASHVLERRPAFAEEGAGIQIGPNGTRLLADLGIAEVLAPRAARPAHLDIMDATTGQRLSRLPLGTWIATRHGAPYWTAHRADLHSAIAGRALADTLVRVTMAAEVDSIVERTDGVTVTTRQGGTFHGAALVAADGLWSTCRRLIFPHQKQPAFARRQAMRAVIPAATLPAPLDRDATTLWFSPGCHVVHYPVRGGDEVAIVVVFAESRPHDGWSSEVLPAHVRSHAAGLAAPLARLLAQPESWRAWSLFTMPEGIVRRWTEGRVALIGDAAHPVLPFLAQGGVLAIEDAVVLARVLDARRADITAALRTFELQRRRRTARVARASLRNGWIYHLDGLPAAARNAAIRTITPHRLMQGFDWLYGWRP